MVNEFKCSKERVTTKVGFKAEGEKCIYHLSVFKANGELVYIDQMTRLLNPRNAVSVLMQAEGPPYF